MNHSNGVDQTRNAFKHANLNGKQKYNFCIGKQRLLLGLLPDHLGIKDRNIFPLFVEI